MNGLKEQTEKEAKLPLYEKKNEVQLDVSLNELCTEMFLDPKWVVKKLRRQIVFCFD